MGRRGHSRYAVWKGDLCLGIGTAEELAEKFGVAKQTIWWWASAANKKRDKDALEAEVERSKAVQGVAKEINTSARSVLETARLRAEWAGARGMQTSKLLEG